MKRSAALCAVVIALGTAGARSSDLNPLGFYVGGAAGQAHDPFTTISGFNESDTGWKAMLGLRPLPFLGAELEYLDYGNERFTPQPVPFMYFSGTAHATAEGLFAVGYLPLRPAPVSNLELFARVGAERVHTTAEGAVFCGLCDLVYLYGVNQTETNFAYGVGLQGGLQWLRLRLEYERTDTSLGHPGLLSLGGTFTF